MNAALLHGVSSCKINLGYVATNANWERSFSALRDFKILPEKFIEPSRLNL